MLALSATYPETLAQQLTNYMRDPTFVRLNPKDLVLQGKRFFFGFFVSKQNQHILEEDFVFHFVKWFCSVSHSVIQKINIDHYRI